MNPRTAVAALAMVGYLLAARGVQSFYPLSTFPMYAGPSNPAVARLMVRAGGEFREVSEFSSWWCDNLPHLEETSCEDARGIAYLDRERERYIRSHPGDRGQPVELVQRVFSFDGKKRLDYCVVARCTAE